MSTMTRSEIESGLASLPSRMRRMSRGGVSVVCAHVENINDEPVWTHLDVDSIEAAERSAASYGAITLLGTSGINRDVAVYSARCDRGPWRACGFRQIMLAQFFNTKLQHAPDSVSLTPFLSEIDDAKAKQAAQQLVSLRCGINAPDVEFGVLHDAILDVNAELTALGVSAGDWTFEPIRAAFVELQK